MAEFQSGWHQASPLLVEHAHMRRAFDRPDRRGLDLSCQIDIADAVYSGLRRRIGRTVIPLKQFDWHGSGRAEIVVGHNCLS